MNQHEEDEDMFAGLLKQFLKTATIVITGTAMTVVASNTHAAKPSSPTCEITPAGSSISVGETVDYSANVSGLNGQKTFSWTFEQGSPSVSSSNPSGPVAYNSAGTFSVSLTVTTNNDQASCGTTVTVEDTAPPPPPPPPPPSSEFPIQTDFKIMMNYELGMHCTGFEFAYCCVLPVYNSILAQVVKPESNTVTPSFPRLLEADPNVNTSADVLGRHTVMRDYELDSNGDFKKYVLRYWHEAQDRSGDPNGQAQTSRLISNVEGNSLMAWNTVFDAGAIVGAEGPCDRGALATGSYNGSDGVVVGNNNLDDVGCAFGVPIDNYQNGVWNHLYIYEISAAGVEGHKPPGTGTAENEKWRLGIHVDYPTNFGPAGHGMQGLLTFSGESGTVVYTQMKVLEDLPIMLTSPNIWEALGLPLTPFEDSIDFFGDPGLIDEDSVRPFVAMKAQMYYYDGGDNNVAVLDGNGEPVIGFGTAPIDIPNCERCHSNGPSARNTPNSDSTQWALVQQEYNFWNAYYDIDTNAGDSDWYSRLKSAAISMLHGHDVQHGTSFTANYAGVECTDQPDPIGNPVNPSPDPCSHLNGLADLTVQTNMPQNTRLGHESVICQKCHADNVIAAVKSATHNGAVIPPVTEAIHINHKGISEVVDLVDNDTGEAPPDGRDDYDDAIGIAFNDSQGRTGGCQGCHPAHKSDGDMSDYPITLAGTNAFEGSDNRDASGGCFVGRDVHSNPNKDTDGAETVAHLNPVGQWLADNVFHDGNSANGGLWCTNCHQQFGQEIWKAENVADHVHAQPGDPGNVREPGDLNEDGVQDLEDVQIAVNNAIGSSYSLDQVKSWLDPADPAVNPSFPDGGVRQSDTTHDIWKANPGLCDYVDSALNPGVYGAVKPEQDANVAVVGVSVGGGTCPGNSALDLDGDGETTAGDLIACNAASFQLCGSYDSDGDFNVLLVGNTAQDNGLLGGVFCTTADCMANATPPTGVAAVPVPFSAATDGRDHWLSAGEPHCADCHAAPYVEQSGNINAFPPFNYPRKASLMRYSRGHQDISCQGCHESIHGLYPVTPTTDTTTYAQAASLNHDGSHGPLKCGTCHAVDNNGIPTWVGNGLEYNGQPVAGDFDAAVSWMHAYTDETSPLDTVCLNCHGVKGNNWDVVTATNKKWIQHAYRDRITRNTMDKVEIEVNGVVSGAGVPGSGDNDDPLETVCVQCHRDRSNKASCNSTRWKDHLIEGRVAEPVWEAVSTELTGSTCGW